MGWIKNLISYFKQPLKNEKYTRWLSPTEVDAEVKWLDDESWEAARVNNILSFFEDVQKDSLEQIRNMAIYDLVKTYAELEYYPLGTVQYEIQCSRAFLRKIASYKLIIKVVNKKLESIK